MQRTSQVPLVLAADRCRDIMAEQDEKRLLSDFMRTAPVITTQEEKAERPRQESRLAANGLCELTARHVARCRSSCGGPMCSDVNRHGNGTPPRGFFHAESGELLERRALGPPPPCLALLLRR